MKNRKFFGVKHFTAVLLTILMLASVVVLPAGAETINNEASSTSEIKFTDISLSSTHTAAIATDGSLYTWGENASGTLGNGTTNDSYSPIKVMSNVKSVVAGTANTIVVTKNGDLYTWGQNYHGQLGNEKQTNFSYVPIKIMSDMNSVAAGDSPYYMAISKTGELYAWGDLRYGQSTSSNLYDITTPSKIATSINEEIVKVSIGSGHNGLITKSGYLYTWGQNLYGELGYGYKDTKYVSTTPATVMKTVKDLSFGGYISAAITDDGMLYTWGSNGAGELGDGNNKDKYSPNKIMDNVVSVSMGRSHGAAITEDGSLYTWGYNNYGQLGDGTTTERNTPTKIMDHVKYVCAGFWSTAAITEDGSLYTWGYNKKGQLGDGTTTNRYTPTKITVTSNNNDSSAPNTTGDIDGDGKITSADSLYILRASVKLENFTDTQNKLADVDKDGKITSSDALLVLRHSVGFRENDYIGKVLNE